MPHLCQDMTEPKAREFSAFLNHNGFQTVPDPEGYRDYLAKITIYTETIHQGNITIYYSPRKKRYKLTFQELKKKNLIPELTELWEKFQGHDPSGEKTDLSGLHAYVDGSFMNGRIGYGAAIIKDGVLLTELNGNVDSKYAAHHQVAGELKAVIETVAFCRREGFSAISVHFDYNGIEKWALGQWKANKELTRLYQKYMLSQPVKITWIKVKAHSGDTWNDRADLLAKKACDTSK